MLRYRSFRNTDPPAIAALWRSRAGQPGLVQPISIDLLEQFIFGKLYFDYAGLILAFDDDRPVGFAHAAFGPNESCNGISTGTGLMAMLLVRPEYAESQVPGGLLAEGEAYLRRRGAEIIYAGAPRPLAPFYLGLYGGADLPGVLDSDTVAQELYPSRGYETFDRTRILRSDLGSFHAPVDRRQIQARRRMLVQVLMDPPTNNWWEACTLGDFDLTRFELVPRGGGPAVARATVRTMLWADGFSAGPSCGLIDLFVEPPHREQGLATFLLSESFRMLSMQGVAAIEVQSRESNAPLTRLYQKLGFREAGQGVVFRKGISR
jgi:GNAT superfamily N-acetyltransferase